jgi:hypothetical protein
MAGRYQMRLVGGCGVDSVSSGYEPVVGFCECGDEPSGSGAAELAGGNEEGKRGQRVSRP